MFGQPSPRWLTEPGGAPTLVAARTARASTGMRRAGVGALRPTVNERDTPDLGVSLIAALYALARRRTRCAAERASDSARPSAASLPPTPASTVPSATVSESATKTSAAKSGCPTHQPIPNGRTTTASRVTSGSSTR